MKRAVWLALLMLGSTTSWAGRPLSVDDANVNESGAGHVEMWVSREAAKGNLYNIAPAYAVADGVEIGALLSRDSAARETLTALQAKWRITASQDDGCNVAAAFGLARSSGSGDSAAYLNGLLSCNGTAAGNLHVNLGGVKRSGVSLNASWSVALERAIGSFTPHVEWFGEQGRSATFQIGARTEISKGLQLDGTVGRTAGNAVYSVGTKVQF